MRAGHLLREKNNKNKNKKYWEDRGGQQGGRMLCGQGKANIVEGLWINKMSTWEPLGAVHGAEMTEETWTEQPQNTLVSRFWYRSHPKGITGKPMRACYELPPGAKHIPGWRVGVWGREFLRVARIPWIFSARDSHNFMVKAQLPATLLAMQNAQHFCQSGPRCP